MEASYARAAPRAFAHKSGQNNSARYDKNSREETLVEFGAININVYARVLPAMLFDKKINSNFPHRSLLPRGSKRIFRPRNNAKSTPRLDAALQYRGIKIFFDGAHFPGKYPGTFLRDATHPRSRISRRRTPHFTVTDSVLLAQCP